MWKKKIGCSPHAKLSVTVQFTIYLWWRARRTYMHACMIARSLVSAITQRSWVDALCSFPCVHYIFRPLRLQGYSCDGWLFSLIAIFPRQSSSPRITTPTTKLSPLQRVARELRSLEIDFCTVYFLPNEIRCLRIETEYFFLLLLFMEA